MVKVIVPNKNFKGKIAGVEFYKGVGKFEDQKKAEYIAQVFGYKLELEDDKAPEDEAPANDEEEDHTEDDGEEIFECPHCDKEYKTKSGLTRHINDKH